MQYVCVPYTIVITTQLLYGCWIGIQPVQSQARSELNNIILSIHIHIICLIVKLALHMSVSQISPGTIFLSKDLCLYMDLKAMVIAQIYISMSVMAQVY